MIFRSPFPDVDVPDVTLPAFVLEQAAARGDRPALIDGATGETLTYGGLVRQVRSLAAGLAGRGIGRGDVVALCAPNAPGYAVGFHAGTALGAVGPTVTPPYTGEERGSQLRTAGAKLADVAEPFAERAREAGAEDILVLGDAAF